MLKILLGVAVVAFSTFCGYFFAKKYRKRKNFFIKMTTFNEKYLNEMGYYKRPLDEFAKHCSLQGEFGSFCLYFLQKLGHKEGVAECRSALDAMGCFSAEEREFIIEYFSALGKGDSITQTQYFSAIKAPLNEYMGRAKSDYGRYGKLYIQMGFLCGVAVLILII